jgi:hypothetical protein
MTTKYQGGCHCGSVRFEVEADLGAPVMTCNCSICSKRGHMLTFVPADKLKITKGHDALTDYQFNKMMVHHLFCKTCGVGSFGRGKKPDGTEMAAINVRCLDGVDLKALEVHEVDGRSF